MSLSKAIRAGLGYKDADPEKVAEIEDKLYDATVIATLITVGVVGKLLVDNYQIKQQLKLIRHNQSHILMASLKN